MTISIVKGKVSIKERNNPSSAVKPESINIWLILVKIRNTPTPISISQKIKVLNNLCMKFTKFTESLNA